MDWQEYEREIEEQFRDNYPSAKITPKNSGRFLQVLNKGRKQLMAIRRGTAVTMLRESLINMKAD